MSTTIPTVFHGTTSFTPEKLNIITEWYQRALGDSDKSTEMLDTYYYDGAVDAFESVLNLIHDSKPAKTINLVLDTKKGFRIKKWHIAAVVIVIMVDGRIPKKIKAELDKKFPVEPIKNTER